MGVRVSQRERERGGGENAAQNGLCLGDKFMKLADKIPEDEPYASAPRIHQHTVHHMGTLHTDLAQAQ